MINFQKILCPIDYSNCSMNALTYAAELALKDSARLYLMYVKYERVPDMAGLNLMLSLIMLRKRLQGWNKN